MQRVSRRPNTVTTELQARVDAVLQSTGMHDDAAGNRSLLRWAAARLLLQRLAHAHAGSEAAAVLSPAAVLDPARAAALRTLAPHCAAVSDGLPAVPSLALLGGCYPHLLDHGERKRHGTWFTGQELAAPTTVRALSPLLAAERDLARLRIVDPAVGAGTFLLEALRALLGAGVPARDAVQCLHGTDLDSTAAGLAALALWEACGDRRPKPAAITANVHQGDGLGAFADGTFDAVLGNPPWETLQRDRRQVDQAPTAERLAWLRAAFKSQGSGKLFTYRLFVERAVRLLRPGGRFGLLVPASLLFDREADPLRELLLDHCDWQWAFGFENRRRLFGIDSRYRFAAILGSRGGPTSQLRVAFGQTDPAVWAGAAPPHLCYARSDLEVLSPAHRTFVAVEHERDLDLLRRIARAGRPLLGSAGACSWRQGDFNMTSDRPHFVPRAAAEAAGYRRGDDAIWRREPGGPGLLPLWQGAMIHDLHPNAAVHAGGSGHSVSWSAPQGPGDLRPQFLLHATAWTGPAARLPARIGLRALANASNERSAVAALLPALPCGNSLGVLQPRVVEGDFLRSAAALAGVLGSLPFDWTLRQRLAGTNLNAFVLADTVVPELSSADEIRLAVIVLRLSAILPWQAPCWELARQQGWLPADHTQAGHAALDRATRRDLLIELDLRVARAFDLRADDLAWMLRDCDHPADRLRDRRFTATLPPRGFWRVDRTLVPERRRTTGLLRAATVLARGKEH